MTNRGMVELAKVIVVITSEIVVSAMVVFGVKDSLESSFDTLKEMELDNSLYFYVLDQNIYKINARYKITSGNHWSKWNS